MSAPTVDAAQYKRELRDVLCAGIDFRYLRANPAANLPSLGRDILRAAEHLNDHHLAGRVPPDELARPAMAEVVTDIGECVRQQQWDRLLPTEWGTRTMYRDYYDLSWAGRAWYNLRRWRLLRWLNAP